MLFILDLYGENTNDTKLHVNVVKDTNLIIYQYAGTTGLTNKSELSMMINIIGIIACDRVTKTGLGFNRAIQLGWANNIPICKIIVDLYKKQQGVLTINIAYIRLHFPKEYEKIKEYIHTFGATNNQCLFLNFKPNNPVY